MKKPPIEIPPQKLSEEALQSIVEEFILREGTDYGRQEVSHEKKLEQVKKQLERGDIKLVFDPNEESVTLLTQKEWEKLN